ncbi:MAG: class I SAM-dependent rRNA methyltransferase [Prevotellaceae bacterium]|nr:class I SAM-dependent rRNA methyltransferase [Prevotellaceae bacterium]
MVQLFLKKEREESLLRFHPWVFSGAVGQVKGTPQEGDVVAVHTHTGDFVALGHYQQGSITVRVLSFEQRPVDDSFWEEALRKALMLREACGLTQHLLPFHPSPFTSCYRLVHGEGDFLPGLIIDIYADTAVMQCHSIGMFRARQNIADALLKIYGNRLVTIFDKSAGTLSCKENDGVPDSYLYRVANPAGEMVENGYRFAVDWEMGQKTGFFLDQRDNRKLVELYANGRSVLNLFCYTGGFSLYALGGGAKLVHSVDSSQKAISLVNHNVYLNHPASTINHQSYTADAMKFLRDVEPNAYDLMILDPPAFAKHKGALHNALQAYKRLNTAAFSRIAPGGIVFTFSCSQVVTKVDFRNAVFSAAAISGRRIRILHQLTQPADHPVNIYHPEGEYLKGLVVYVE